MAETYREIWKHASTLRLFVLTFLGIVIQSIIVLAAFGASIKTTMETGSLATNVLTLEYVVYTTINLGVVFGYSLITSVSFYPKRRVSPFLIMIGTTSLMLAFAMNISAQTETVTTSQRALLLFTLAIVYFMIMTMFSWVLSLVLYHILGLNGMPEDLEKQSFSITADYQRIRELLTDRYFLRDNELNIEENRKELIVLTSHRNTDIHISVAAIPQEKKEHEHPIVAIAGYEIKYDSLANTGAVRRRVSRLRNDIVGELQKVDPNAKATTLVDENDALYSVMDNALEVTSSPLRNVSRRIIASIVGLGILAGALYIPFHYGSIDLGTFVVALVSIASVIVTLTVPALKERKRPRSASGGDIYF